MSATVAAAPPLQVHELSSLARARQIAEVLARHHLWHLIELFALEHLVPFGHHRPAPGDRPPMAPRELRMALEELGPTFMKLGQVLSTRADLLAPELRAELAQLQDQAPPIPLEAILETIESELGEPASRRFASFDDTPLATGSIGQAHLARLADGTEVVVKVRRPGAVEQIDEDLKLLHHLAAIGNSRIDRSQGIDLVGIVREFDASLRAEVDYQHEGRNAERFGQNFKQSGRVHIPRIFWDWTTSRVLTMERIRGSRITDAAALQAACIAPDDVANNATHIVLKMLLEDGFFHADLHPGNLFIESARCIGLIDFGMVGIIDEDTRSGLGSLLVAVEGRNSESMVDALLSLGVAAHVDRGALRRDLDDLVSKYHGMGVGETSLGVFLNDVFEVVRPHHLVMPSALSMLAKTVMTAEGMIAELDPSFQLMKAAVPYLQRLVLKENSPVAWGERLGRAAPDVMWLATESPRILRRAMGNLDKGQLALAIEPKGVEPHLRRMEHMANRLELSMILSALVVAAAVILSVYHPGVVGSPLDVVLVVCLGAVALVLAWRIWISRPRRTGTSPERWMSP